MSRVARDATARLLIFLAGLCTVVFLTVFLLTRLLGGGAGPVALTGEKVGVLEIRGIIVDSRQVLESLKRFAEDRQVKGILVRIDSPGGAVAPSQEIYRELARIHKEGKKKIVASFGNVAASGGYYIAAAADKIVSNPGTITGSIGVIMELSNVQELLDKIGVESYVIKSGELKDIGSITRPITEREKQVLQSVIDDVYMQFVEHVAEGRGMAVEKVKLIANGSIFSGRQALGLGLVDTLGTFQDAVDLVAELAGIEGKPRLVYDQRERLGWIDYVVNRFARGLSQIRRDHSQWGVFYLMQ